MSAPGYHKLKTQLYRNGEGEAEIYFLFPASEPYPKDAGRRPVPLDGDVPPSVRLGVRVGR